MRNHDPSTIFQNLVSRWHNEQNSRLIWDYVHDPVYLSIIGMGQDAVPLILRRLQYELQIGEPDDWFVALQAITRENPIPTESRGNVKEIAKAWVKWGLQQGLLDPPPES